jgi:hypothetical protein
MRIKRLGRAEAAFALTFSRPTAISSLAGGAGGGGKMV